MNKLNLESKDIVNNNVELISRVFPHCITEQDGKKLIDFEKLKNEFSNELVDGTKEKYELNWPGKRAAINEARIPTNKTLIPVGEKSVDFTNTSNVYIEGDNLEVLKILQEAYLNRVKCIYIDPPYNTGKDFIYKDNFKHTTEAELLKSGQVDKDGNKYIQNTETNGRYHSDWLSMMYPRLKLARNLLTEDGVIFISIDDNEYDNLKKLCDEIFGEVNFISSFVWEKTSHVGRQKKNCYSTVENILCYAKKLYDESGLKELLVEYQKTEFEDAPLFNKSNPTNVLNFPKGSIEFSIFDGLYTDTTNDNFRLIGDCIVQNGRNTKEVSLEFKSRWGQAKIIEEFKKGAKYLVKGTAFSIRVEYAEGKVSSESPKQLIKTTGENRTKNKYNSLVGTTEQGSSQLVNIGLGSMFDFPKPFTLLSYLLSLIESESSDIILDFFSGSSTTAHSVMDLNSKDKGNRKYIMVQLPETIDPKKSKSAYDFCIENDLEPIIPSIAQERIKRAGAKIKEETGADIDYGFRVFKLTDSILKSNEVLPQDMQQDLLSQSDGKYVDGISKLDIVTSIILNLGLMLDSKIEELDNDNFIIEDGLLFISLSDKYDSSVLDIIRDIDPDQVVFDERSFTSDSELTNVEQQIKEINSDITINIL